MHAVQSMRAQRSQDLSQGCKCVEGVVGRHVAPAVRDELSVFAEPERDSGDGDPRDWVGTMPTTGGPA